MTDGTQVFYNLGASTQLIVDSFGYFAEPLSTFAPPAMPADGKADAGGRSQLATTSHSQF